MPSNKNQAETSLSDLALTELGDRLPGLISHLLGFELINSHEGNTRAAGVLGFDVNGQRVLIPCLFLNGRLRAMEIMYLADTDTFVSATPQWVEYITTRSSGITGEPDARGSQVGTVPSNSLMIFNRAPQISKRAGFDEFAEWCGPEKAIVADDAKPKFLDALRSMGKHAYVSFMSDVASHPELFDRVLDHYDIESLKLAEFDSPEVAQNDLSGKSDTEKLAGWGDKSDEDEGKKHTEYLKTVSDKDLDGFIRRNAWDSEWSASTPELKKSYAKEKASYAAEKASRESSKAEKKLAFVTHSDLEADPSAFDLDTKLKVMSTGQAILDKRAAAEKSEFYADDYSKSFTEVTESGWYSMINSRGEFLDVIVAHNPLNVTRPKGSRSGTLIFHPKSGVWYDTRVGEPLLARRRRNGGDEEYAKWLDGLPTISSARPNKNYVLVGPKGDMSSPFSIRSRSSEKGVTTLEIAGTGFIGYAYCGCSGAPYAEALRIVGEGTGLKQLGDVVATGSDWKIWEVASDPKSSSEYDTFAEARKELRPASASVITDAMAANGILELGVTKQANDYIVSLAGENSPLLRKNACVRNLCTVIGLDATTAQELVDNVADGARAVAWVKRADIYNGMAFPAMDNAGGTNEQGVPETYGQSQTEMVPMNNPESPDPFNPDLANYDKIKKNDVEFLMRAADAGSTNVFDPAMIGVLLKTNRTLIQVDQWIPDLVTSLDRLCRTLLLFYWKNPDFSSGYGSDEMAELEDVLLSVIKSMGTIVLFFKQRASESPGTKIDAFSGN